MNTLTKVSPLGILYRWKEYLLREFRFFMIFAPLPVFDDVVKKMVLRLYGMWLQKEIKDPKMREKLRPNFKLGCKRILISDEYYNRMNDKHFTLDNTKILNINKVLH